MDFIFDGFTVYRIMLPKVLAINKADVPLVVE